MSGELRRCERNRLVWPLKLRVQWASRRRWSLRSGRCSSRERFQITAAWWSSARTTRGVWSSKVWRASATRRVEGACPHLEGTHGVAGAPGGCGSGDALGQGGASGNTRARLLVLLARPTRSSSRRPRASPLQVVQGIPEAGTPHGLPRHSCLSMTAATAGTSTSSSASQCFGVYELQAAHTLQTPWCCVSSSRAKG